MSTFVHVSESYGIPIDYRCSDRNIPTNSFDDQESYGLNDVEIEKFRKIHGLNIDVHKHRTPQRLFPSFTIFCFSILTMVYFILCILFLDWYLYAFGCIFISLAVLSLVITKPINKFHNYICKDANTTTDVTNHDHVPKYSAKVIRNHKTKHRLLVSGYLKKYKIITHEYQMRTNDDIINLIGTYCSPFVQTIAASELVPGDIVLINKGDLIRTKIKILERSENFTLCHPKSLPTSINTNYSIIGMLKWSVHSVTDMMISFGSPFRSTGDIARHGECCMIGTAKAMVIATGIKKYETLKPNSWNRERSCELDDYCYYFEWNFTETKINVIINQSILPCWGCVVLLMVGYYFNNNLIWIIAQMLSCTVLFVSMCRIIILVLSANMLRNKLTTKQLYFKAESWQWVLAEIHIIVFSIDDIFPNIQTDADERTRFSQVIQLCNKLRIKLVMATKFGENYTKYISALICSSTDDKTHEHIFLSSIISSSEKVAYIKKNETKHNCMSDISNRVLVISSDPDDVICFRYSCISIALGNGMSSDIELQTCSGICKAEHPLIKVVEGIQVARNATSQNCLCSKK